MKRKQTIIIALPERGKIIERELDEVTLNDLQFAVGGYIEVAPDDGLSLENIAMLVDEEGLLKCRPVNQNLLPYLYAGNCVFVGIKEDEHGERDFTGLDMFQIHHIDDYICRLGYIAWQNSLPRG